MTQQSILHLVVNWKVFTINIHTYIHTYKLSLRAVCVVQECELSVLQTLKWDVASVTPYDFLDQIFVRLPSLDCSTVARLRRHCQTLIALCATGPSVRPLSRVDFNTRP